MKPCSFNISSPLSKVTFIEKSDIIFSTNGPFSNNLHLKSTITPSHTELIPY